MKLDAEPLSRVLITGVISSSDKKNDDFIFPPVPNLIFTRDIGIVVNGHLLLTKPAELARQREAIITKYIAYYELFKHDIENDSFSDKVIELNEDRSFLLEDDDDKRMVTVEGGDVMMVAPNHLLIGCSIRTSPSAIEKIIQQLFKKKVLNKVSVVKIPEKRDFMHIDTVFTQVKKNMWVVFGKFAGTEQADTGVHIADTLRGEKKVQKAAKVKVTQFIRQETATNKGYKVLVDESIESLEELLYHVSVEDLGCKKNEVDVVYCADGEFPYDEREQWTDACNLLALKEGVVVGYDRNPFTINEFQKRGFYIIKAAEFIKKMKDGADLNELLKQDTFILLPSSELSRARGGSHCMSMPLLRENIV